MTEVLINSILSGANYTLFALGVSCAYAVTRSFNFAFAGVYSFAAYMFYVASKMLGLPLLVSLPFGMLLACLLGVAFEFAIQVPLYRRGGSSLTKMLASLAVLIILQNSISMIFGDSSLLLRSSEIPIITIAGISVTVTRLAALGAVAVLVPGTWLLLRVSAFGKQMRAISSDPELARSKGIRYESVILWVTVLSSTLVSIAAIIQGFDTDLVPFMGFSALMMGIVATIVGGAGSVWGVALGGFLVGIAQNLAVWYLPSQWQDTVVFFILIVFLIFRPTGFMGSPISKFVA
jgi:branched-subunit amino acid ABC-type transport system permease component